MLIALKVQFGKYSLNNGIESLKETKFKVYCLYIKKNKFFIWMTDSVFVGI